jgi:polyphosphate kinase
MADAFVEGFDSQIGASPAEERATTSEPPDAVELNEPLGEPSVPVDDLVAGSVRIDLTDPSLYINRELGLLAFQERVLEEAEDESNPLLERVKFISILSSNMAEFYMVRLAGLKQQVQAGVTDTSPDGLTPAEQLELCRDKALEILRAGRRAYASLVPQLAKEGIHILDYHDLPDEERRVADDYFVRSVFPVLTPLALDPGRPFPHISNLSLNLAVIVKGPDGEGRFARVKIPRSLPRLVALTGRKRVGREYHFVWLEQLVAAHLGALFPGMEIAAAHPFRVTRDAEVAIQELEADDLLETIEESVRRRRFGAVVRVTVDPSMPEDIRTLLAENLEVEPADIVTLQPPLGMSELMELAKLDRPDLLEPPFVPAVPPELADPELQDIFALIREHDLLLHHPFDSFEPIVRLLWQAAHDPDVLAIKMTLYRVGRNAPVVEALLDAAREGKEVTVLVELKARFDEESNIEWAKALEAEGVHVVYGLLGLKVHSKLLLIVRRERSGLRRYLHVGTGNYNVVTARLYTDLGVLTDDQAMAAEVAEVFNYITGYGLPESYPVLSVAPHEMRSDLVKLIEREMSHAEEGRPARLIFKMNSLVDPKIIRLLYRASQAGVETDLVVRGICCLRPGVPGLSDRIRVRSIVGRFLEHSRIYWFANDGDPRVLIGSADLMQRNLNRRVEVLTPVLDPALVSRLEDILAVYLADNVKARIMQPDGSYRRANRGPQDPEIEAQRVFLPARED